MNEFGSVETFQQDAAELLDSLEFALLELGTNPHGKDPVDTAFRALHNADVAMFTGVTILGDGTASIILDVAQLAARAQGSAEGAIWAEAA